MFLCGFKKWMFIRNWPIVNRVIIKVNILKSKAKNILKLNRGQLFSSTSSLCQAFSLSLSLTCTAVVCFNVKFELDYFFNDSNNIKAWLLLLSTSILTISSQISNTFDSFSFHPKIMLSSHVAAFDRTQFVRSSLPQKGK